MGKLNFKPKSGNEVVGVGVRNSLLRMTAATEVYLMEVRENDPEAWQWLRSDENVKKTMKAIWEQTLRALEATCPYPELGFGDEQIGRATFDPNNQDAMKTLLNLETMDPPESCTGYR